MGSKSIIPNPPNFEEAVIKMNVRVFRNRSEASLTDHKHAVYSSVRRVEGKWQIYTTSFQGNITEYCDSFDEAVQHLKEMKTLLGLRVT